ncbi:MAG: 5'-nucleotidase C-terminal domain-containing protein [Solobacterium sp.]|nr:5'-nucleotidase C-terminal domain-containing protein [Solobacterium sp.]
MAQLKTAIRKWYDPDTCLLVDAGDTVQGNSAFLFLDEPYNPIIRAMNELGYEVWTTGNHEYNYGMNVLRRLISGFQGHTIVSKVRDETGSPLGERWAIIEKNGIRIAVVCMVTPNISLWDAANLRNCEVRNPISETEAILKEIEGKYDVLIAVNHMSIPQEYDTPGSGCAEYAEHFPQFDVIVASHQHLLEEETEVNGVLIAENSSFGETMLKIDLTMQKSVSGWKVTDRTSRALRMSDYEPDPEFMETYRPYHEQILASIRSEIGISEGPDGFLIPSETECIPGFLLQNAPLVNLFHDAAESFTDADITASMIASPSADLLPGAFCAKDLLALYPYENTLCLVRMNGRQLKKYMEWSASFYNTFRPGDLTISFDPSISLFDYDFFRGVNYEIDISKQPGERIVNLRKADGTPVQEDDSFTVAVSSYRYQSHLSLYGPVFSEEDGLPVLIEGDIRPDLGAFTDLLAEYIRADLDGTVGPDTSENWKLIGVEWDPQLHQKAIELINSGAIVPELTHNYSHLAAQSITENDLKDH